MNKVTLLGDSIRLGYQETVTSELGGMAEVWSPDENCMHSVHHLFHPEWYLEQPADVIHFNFGLWDCRRLGRDRKENAVPVGLFTRNLDFILERASRESNAKLIWATITPVVQARYNARFTKPCEPCREAADCALYNSAAAPILKKYAVPINDLHQFVVEQGTEEMVCEDGIHYTAEGYRKLGVRVASEIRKLL